MTETEHSSGHLKQVGETSSIIQSVPKLRILANSVPKAGTHLLKKCLGLLPDVFDTRIHLDIGLDAQTLQAHLESAANGGFFTAHLPYWAPYIKMLEDLQYKTILMLRDPRDLVISFAHFVTKTKDHYLHTYYQQLANDNERITNTIVGLDDGTLFDIGTLHQIFLGWSQSSNNCIIRFENLVGPMGGGSYDTQVREIKQIADHLIIELSVAKIERIAGRLFDTASPTFRKGVIGDWKNHFSAQHKQVFKNVAGQLLIDLGYETDFDW